MYDVAVIGAGPAGSMAAWKIAAKGHSVVMIDRRKTIGSPVQCGEGLSNYAIMTNDLEPHGSWIKQEILGARVFVPNGKHVLIKGKGYSIDREIFDQHIAELAREAGTEIRLETMVKGMKKNYGEREEKSENEEKSEKEGQTETDEKNEHREGSSYWVLDCQDGSEIQARYVIGADGPHAIVAGWAGIPFKTENVLGYQYKYAAEYVEQNMTYEFQEKNRLEGEWLDFHYDTRWPNGYVWVFPRGEEYNIGICGPGKLKEELDTFCRETGLDPDQRREINAGQIPRGTVITQFVKDNVLIVGDAAGLTNPLTKGGIHAALFSGREAGNILCEAIEQNDPGLTAEYERIMRRSSFTDPAMMEHGKLIYSLTNYAASFVGDLLNEKDIHEFSCIRSIVPIVKNPKIIPFIPRFLKILKALQISSIYGW